MTSRNEYLVWAREHLQEALRQKSAKELYEMELSLHQAHGKPEDIGTTDEALMPLRRELFIPAVKEWLAEARSDDSCLQQDRLYRAMFCLEKARAKPEDVGETEVSLHALRRKIFIPVAMGHLESARRGGFGREIRMMEDSLREARATYEDIGTTPDEVKRLRRESRIGLAKFSLHQARRYRSAENFQSLENSLKGARIAPEEVGESAASIAALKRECFLTSAKACLDRAKKYLRDANAIPEGAGAKTEKRKARTCDLAEARKQLRLARESKSLHHFKLLKSHLESSSTLLEELGETTDSFAALRRECLVSGAAKCLEEMGQHLQEVSAAYTDIGETLVSIAALRRKLA